MKILDFRSDTVSQPTVAMRTAMAAAEVGDDILGEDPSVIRLEAQAAALMQKEAGLFCISGTMANQVAIMALTSRGDEILVGEDSHIYNLEVSGLAVLSGVQPRPLRAVLGHFDPVDIAKAIRRRGLQSAVTRVLCLENTYDLNRGIPLPPAYLHEIAARVRRNGLTVYLDGARIFNAALACGVTPADMAAPVDALQFCLSKGLSAPVGALLVGEKDFIERCRWMRQRLGGGMRQAGHMAAAGCVALEEMVGRLEEDHANATRLAEGLAAIDPRLVDLSAPRTNIVRIDFGAAGKTSGALVEQLHARNVRIKQIDDAVCRMVTHWDLDATDIDTVLDILRDILR